MKKLFSLLIILSLIFTAMPVNAQTAQPVLMYASQQSEINLDEYTLQASAELPDEVTLGIDEYYAKQLTDYNKKIYRALVDGLTSIEPDDLKLKQRVQVTYVIKITEPDNTLANSLYAEEISKFDSDALYNALQYDHTEFFWMREGTVLVFGAQVLQYDEGYPIQFTIDIAIDSSNLFDSDDELTFAALNVNDTVDSILDYAPATDDYDKVVYFNNWLKEHNTYNHTHLEDNNYPLAHTAYSAFVSNNDEPTGPVCQGYAYAFKYLCDRAGIECVVVSGTLYQSLDEPGPHAWNAVKIDGSWYGVDVTSNDSLGTDDYNLLVGSETTSHDPTFTTFGASHVVDSAHTYPTLSSTAYQPPTAEIASAGASIRIGDNAGLRFRTTITKNKFYDKYYPTDDEGKNYTYDANNNLMFGTLLIPTNLILEGYSLEEMFEEGKSNILDIPAEKIFDQNGETLSFTGVVIGIPKTADAYWREITAVSYVKYRKDESPEWEYSFADATEDSYYNVAKKARNSDDYSDSNNPDPSEEVKAVMQHLDDIIKLVDNNKNWIDTGKWY